MDVGGKRVDATPSEIVYGMGHDPRDTAGPNGEIPVVTEPVSGMEYRWTPFIDAQGKRRRVLQEFDSSGKVVRPHVILEADGNEDGKYRFKYNKASKTTSVVDREGKVIASQIPADWISGQYGELPIPRRVVKELKKSSAEQSGEAKKPEEVSTLTIDHSKERELSSADMVRGATKFVMPISSKKTANKTDKDE